MRSLESIIYEQVNRVLSPRMVLNRGRYSISWMPDPGDWDWGRRTFPRLTRPVLMQVRSLGPIEVRRVRHTRPAEQAQRVVERRLAGPR